MIGSHTKKRESRFQDLICAYTCTRMPTYKYTYMYCICTLLEEPPHHGHSVIKYCWFGRCQFLKLSLKTLKSDYCFSSAGREFQSGPTAQAKQDLIPWDDTVSPGRAPCSGSSRALSSHNIREQWRYLIIETFKSQY